MITVQPIRYTSRTTEWHRFAQALGLVPAFAPTREWSAFDGAGVLAVHHALPGEPRDGGTDFHLCTDDLDGVETRLRDVDVDVTRSVVADVGPLLTVTASSGARLTVSGGPRPADHGPLSVLPIWYQEDLAESRRVLEAIGLRPRIASNSASWADFTADGGGLAAVHRDTRVRIELAWEYSGDLDVFTEHLAYAGVPAVIIDEAYSRTVRVTSPDGDELWINATQDDLYGFTRLSATP